MTELRADCARCQALCCVGLSFARSSEFAITKPPGVPCPNLGGDDRCTIHTRLRPAGFSGCATYDCFGAGQRVSQVTFGGRHWRDSSQSFAALLVLQQLHELLWYLTDVLDRGDCAPIRPAIDAARRLVDDAAGLAAPDPQKVLALDPAAFRAEVDPVLLEASTQVRAGLPRRPDHRRADLAGARLAGADLRGADLRGAQLTGADLRGADLRRADLIGADLRGADLAGADLGRALYVTSSQLRSARGDTTTALPPRQDRPAHWTGRAQADEPSQ